MDPNLTPYLSALQDRWTPQDRQRELLHRQHPDTSAAYGLALGILGVIALLISALVWRVC